MNCLGYRKHPISLEIKTLFAFQKRQERRENGGTQRAGGKTDPMQKIIHLYFFCDLEKMSDNSL